MGFGTEVQQITILFRVDAPPVLKRVGQEWISNRRRQPFQNVVYESQEAFTQNLAKLLLCMPQPLGFFGPKVSSFLELLGRVLDKESMPNSEYSLTLRTSHDGRTARGVRVRDQKCTSTGGKPQADFRCQVRRSIVAPNRESRGSFISTARLH